MVGVASRYRGRGPLVRGVARGGGGVTSSTSRMWARILAPSRVRESLSLKGVGLDGAGLW